MTNYDDNFMQTSSDNKSNPQKRVRYANEFEKIDFKSSGVVRGEIASRVSKKILGKNI